MILSRTVFHAKFGKADDVVARFKESMADAPDEQLAQLQPRILTDISGRFDTVVIETTHESLAALEQFRAMLFQQDSERVTPNDMLDLVETGYNEYYTIEM